jgi:hypothetical protein
MKTEIQGDFKGYLLRFKMPSKRCFTMPLKSAGLILLLELILSGAVCLLGIQTWSIVLSLVVCMVAVGYYVGVLYKDFWNIVLEESKGFFADVLMWVYYMAICAVSLSPALVLLYTTTL